MSCAEGGDTSRYRLSRPPERSGRSHTSAWPRLPPGAASVSKRQRQPRVSSPSPYPAGPNSRPIPGVRCPGKTVTAGAPGFYQCLMALSISHCSDSRPGDTVRRGAGAMPKPPGSQRRTQTARGRKPLPHIAVCYTRSLDFSHCRWSRSRAISHAPTGDPASPCSHHLSSRCGRPPRRSGSPPTASTFTSGPSAAR